MEIENIVLIRQLQHVHLHVRENEDHVMMERRHEVMEIDLVLHSEHHVVLLHIH